MTPATEAHLLETLKALTEESKRQGERLAAIEAAIDAHEARDAERHAAITKRLDKLDEESAARALGDAEATGAQKAEAAAKIVKDERTKRFHEWARLFVAALVGFICSLATLAIAKAAGLK